jgi:hypothetical protein
MEGLSMILKSLIGGGSRWKVSARLTDFGVAQPIDWMHARQYHVQGEEAAPPKGVFDSRIISAGP